LKKKTKPRSSTSIDCKITAHIQMKTHFVQIAISRHITARIRDIPSVTARVIAAELSLELSKLGVRKLVRRHFGRAHNLAKHIDLAKANLADHVDEFAEFNLTIVARVDFLDERGDLLRRRVLSKVLERRGDLGRVNTGDAAWAAKIQESNSRVINIRILQQVFEAKRVCRMMGSNHFV
jgi:hypothetical protein